MIWGARPGRSAARKSAFTRVDALIVGALQTRDRRTVHSVIAGPDPAIHAAPLNVRRVSMDHRVKPGGDEGFAHPNDRELLCSF